MGIVHAGFDGTNVTIALPSSLISAARRSTVQIVPPQPSELLEGPYYGKVGFLSSCCQGGSGSGRRIFQTGPLTFGVVICHEGWRYPETVRWAVRHGAQIVFQPHFHEAEPGGYMASSFADPANSFHEKAVLCRAAENTCYFATVNCASAGSPTTSAVVRPDGTLLSYRPYGKQGLLIADIDIAAATGILAARCKSVQEFHRPQPK